MTDRRLIESHIAKGLEDPRKGKTHGRHSSAGDAIKVLETRSKRQQKKRKR